MYKGLKNGKDRDRQKIYTEKRDHVATETLYLKIDSNVLVHQKNLIVKDIAQTACANSSVQNKVQTLKLSNLQISKPGRYVKSVLDVLEAIQKEYPSLKIENLGEADFIITYEEEKGKSRLIGYLKTILVSVLSFFGAAFSIMQMSICYLQGRLQMALRYWSWRILLDLGLALFYFLITLPEKESKRTLRLWTYRCIPMSKM